MTLTYGICSSGLGSGREFVWASADARRPGDSGYRVCQITCCNTVTQENLLENFDKFFLCAIVKIYLDLFFISLKQPNTLLKRTHRPAGAKWHQCRDQKRLISFSAFNIQHVDVKMSTSHKWGITQSKHHLFESQKTLFSPKPLTVLTETTRHSWGRRTNCPRSETNSVGQPHSGPLIGQKSEGRGGGEKFFF